LARSTSPSIGLAPSNKLKWLWQCRCTNGGTDIEASIHQDGTRIAVAAAYPSVERWCRKKRFYRAQPDEQSVRQSEVSIQDKQISR
jgi:hypothetical protein